MFEKVMKQLIRLLVVFCFFGYSSKGWSQSAIPATGLNAAGTGGTVSYSVGQVVYLSLTETSASVSQGVQQPYEVSVIEQEEGITLVCSVYPNPFTDFLILKVENQEYKTLTCRLYDINGNLLENKRITGIETKVEMRSDIPGIYFLEVSSSGKKLKTFKIIKK
jgi:hypothetical protein